MLDQYWESENLIFSEFSSVEAQHAKSIFDSNLKLKEYDPTFREWPLSEYDKLINESAQEKTPNELQAFYLRKISTLDGEAIGYIQLEINAPGKDTLWIPMLTILPHFQRKGFGSEIINSTIDTVRNYTSINHVGLNVYAENIKAFRFWYRQGFTDIRAFEPEKEFGQEYHCLALFKSLQAG